MTFPGSPALSNLSPDQVAGMLDQANQAVVDSEGAVLGSRAGGQAAAEEPAFSPETEALLDADRAAARERKRLPDRRATVGVTIVQDGIEYQVDYGLHPRAGNVREIFLEVPANAPVDKALLADAAAIVSLALQSGIAATDLMNIVGIRLSEKRNGFASILGAALAEAVKIDREPKLL